MRARRVLLLVYPEVRLLDVAGLLQVFRDARGPDGEVPFRVQMVSPAGGPIETGAGRATYRRRQEELMAQAAPVRCHARWPGGGGHAPGTATWAA